MSSSTRLLQLIIIVIIVVVIIITTTTITTIQKRRAAAVVGRLAAVGRRAATCGGDLRRRRRRCHLFKAVFGQAYLIASATPDCHGSCGWSYVSLQVRCFHIDKSELFEFTDAEVHVHTCVRA